MNYLKKLTPSEKSDLEFYLGQERDSAAVEGFQLDEEAFKQAWARVVVSRRVHRLQGEAARTVKIPKEIANATPKALRKPAEKKPVPVASWMG